jgi:hypothetical protein
MMTDTTFEIHATMTGPLWWPIGEPAEKEVSYTFRRDDVVRPFVDNAETLYDAVSSLMTKEDGDFSGPATIDGYLVAIRRTARHEHRRFFELSAFSSIADMVTS